MNTAGDLVPRGPPKKQVGKFMGVKKGPPAAPRGAKKGPPAAPPGAKKRTLSLFYISIYHIYFSIFIN